MSLPININDLIDGRVVESARIEYKKDWNPEPIIHSICAFANDIDNWGGGYILIGIEEKDGMPKFPIEGLPKDSIDKINKELLEKCNLIEPRYIPVVEHITYDGKDVIILWAPGGSERPYKCPTVIAKSTKSDKAFYIRKMSNTIRANAREERKLFSKSEDIPFDDRVNTNAKLSDIKGVLIQDFLERVQSDLYNLSENQPVINTARSMKLLGGPEENLKPLNVALMFFNYHPEDFFPYSYIEVVDKPDPTGIGMTERTFKGPLDRQLKDALDFIHNYVIKVRIIKHKDKAEADRINNYPYAAIEEILANAVYHRSYQVREPITVIITPGKIEILSFPGPDRSISDEDLKNCQLVSTSYRNRRIGDYLKELKFIEGRNTGIPTALVALKRNGSPMPVFKTDADRSYLRVTLFEHEIFREQYTPAENTFETAVSYSTSSLQDTIISILKKAGDISTAQLVKELGYVRTTRKLNQAIAELMDKEIIEYTDKVNKFSRNQKLHLINSGL